MRISRVLYTFFCSFSSTKSLGIMLKRSSWEWLMFHLNHHHHLCGRGPRKVPHLGLQYLKMELSSTMWVLGIFPSCYWRLKIYFGGKSLAEFIWNMRYPVVVQASRTYAEPQDNSSEVDFLFQNLRCFLWWLISSMVSIIAYVVKNIRTPTRTTKFLMSRNQ